MGSEIKVQVILKETIKPSSPTPHHQRSLSLSVFDQFQPEIYIPLVLFYPKTSDKVNVDHHSLFAEKSKLLKTSLSKALTHFYPFAGEFVHNLSITCNDRGAAFHEAQVNCPISNILDKPNFAILKKLVPVAMETKQAEAGHLLLVQANLFECGGLAIGVGVSHKVGDATTFCTFIKTWAQIAFGSTNGTADPVVLPAEFGVAASLFPPHDFFNSPKPTVEFSIEKCSTRRYVFDASKMAALKAKAASATVPNPTRVEAVSALIWKCAIEASRSKLGFNKPSLWCQVVNMRKRSPGLTSAENILGNFMWYFTAMTVESEFDYQSLVGKLRTGIEGYKEKYPNGVSGEEVLETIKVGGNLLERDDIEVFSCTSWCRFPFYEVDFGWGKPSWVSIRSSEFKNIVMMLDMSDGVGIEALLTFREEDMAIIENNEELLAYATLNQTV